MGVGSGLYMYDVVVKRSRSLSHLLISSCVCLLAKRRTSCTWKDAIHGFPVSPVSAETPVTGWENKADFIAYFLSNTSAKNYQNRL